MDELDYLVARADRLIEENRRVLNQIADEELQREIGLLDVEHEYDLPPIDGGPPEGVI